MGDIKQPEKTDEKPKDKTKKTMTLSKNELVILAQNACINDMRFSNATRESHVDELASDVKKERGLREIMQNKNAHLTRKSLTDKLAEKQTLRVIQKAKPGFSTGTVIGIGFFLLIIGIIFGVGITGLFGVR